MVSSGQSSAMWSGLVTAHSHQAQHFQHHDTEATEPLLGIFTEPQCRELKTTRTTSFFPKDIVVQSLSCVWLCDPMDYSTPGFPVLHHLPEFAQTHVHWVNDAIQPSHSQLSPAFSLSQHQSFFPVSLFLTAGG